MKVLPFLLLIAGTVPSFSDPVNNHAFPKDFWFGVGTASYQIEGATDIDGKGENIWDRFLTLFPNVIFDGSNGKIACDAYLRYKEDVQLMKYLGVHHYRFSIAWSRILPTGFTNYLNQPGIDHYRNLIKELRENNIEPVVTMYHWDLPQPIQDAGGFTSELFVEWFEDYARVLLELYGDDVKHWFTFNEPKQVCHAGYGNENRSFAPGVASNGIGEYICAHNIIKAHARVWHMYDDEFRPKQKGKLGITLDTTMYQPETNSTEDIEATARMMQFSIGWYAHPLFKGDYPQLMKDTIAKRSKQQGFKKSRLPTFTEEEIQYINGSVDWLGVNCYTAQIVRHLAHPDSKPGYENDMEAMTYYHPEWPFTAAVWIRVTPWSLANYVRWLRDQYNNPLMLVTENGFPDNGTSLIDDHRINYYQQYLSHIRETLDEGTNLMGYTTWSLLDSFEWRFGYTTRYGLYHVNHKGTNATRTPKKSVEFYKKLISTRCLVDTCIE